jgi:hypothetical protein
MLADHLALSVQVHYGDASAAAGEFGLKSDVAQADLKTVTFGLDAREWKSRKIKELDGREAGDCVFQCCGRLRFKMHVCLIGIEGPS